MSVIEFLNGQFFAAIISGIVAFIALSTVYRRSLDLESDWRKTLFKAAGSEEITMEQVQLLRTALRYGKVDDTKVKMYSFFWFTNLVIDFCDYLREKKKQCKKGEYLLEEEEQEVIRIFIRCLLKHNWEVNENLKAKLLRKRIDETKYMKESYEKAYEEYEKAYEEYEKAYEKKENKKFNFKKYIENQGENKEENEMGKKEKILGLVVLFILFVLLLLRVLCELFKWNVNISNETMVFAIIIALMFFFFKE